MRALLVMTVIGADRPGIVDSLARLISNQGGNWLESKMSRLGGQFAGILRVDVPADRESSLRRELADLSKEGLAVAIQRDPVSPEDAAAPDVATPILMSLEIVGHDRPGIVHQISRALAVFKVNVEELETGCESAPMSGETLFRARARVLIPRSCDLANLRQSLETIAADLLVDLALEPK